MRLAGAALPALCVSAGLPIAAIADPFAAESPGKTAGHAPPREVTLAAQVNRTVGKRTGGGPGGSRPPPCKSLKTAIAANKMPALIAALKAQCAASLTSSNHDSCKLARRFHYSAPYTGRREEANFLLQACLTHF